MSNKSHDCQRAPPYPQCNDQLEANNNYLIVDCSDTLLFSLYCYNERDLSCNRIGLKAKFIEILIVRLLLYLYESLD